MRIWSIHPKYLDSKRLTAQWREALLCRAVLEGKTKGYTKHPQFLRIKEHHQPHYFINMFLYEIWKEGKKRDYQFDKSKLVEEMFKKYKEPFIPMEVTEDQLEYEFEHMQSKLDEFHTQKMTNLQYFNEEGVLPNELFVTIPGPIMNFEKIKDDYERRI